MISKTTKIIKTVNNNNDKQQQRQTTTTKYKYKISNTNIIGKITTTATRKKQIHAIKINN